MQGLNGEKARDRAQLRVARKARRSRHLEIERQFSTTQHGNVNGLCDRISTTRLRELETKFVMILSCGISLFPRAPPPKATSISKATRNSPKPVVLWFEHKISASPPKPDISALMSTRPSCYTYCLSWHDNTIVRPHPALIAMRCEVWGDSEKLRYPLLISLAYSICLPSCPYWRPSSYRAAARIRAMNSPAVTTATGSIQLSYRARERRSWALG